MSNEVKYGLDGCKRGIRAARKNIQTFKEAIEKEEKTIEQLKYMMGELERKEKLREIAEETIVIEGKSNNGNKKRHHD